ncbi:hypothetical protein GCM10011487_12060 [Steroidobacter agaridevorans]|uniref:Uncharacterized protein n=1 Tax=Steroidobacter agaridevorans TaxID=2695856 RepID=A0A829Y8X2_9GAMM|nr:hypothetical protein [Steroidobacter agaridevorans]GFE79206.1 hypothetical protein GCM10011487_12060 [Steroidobacter agaridevorans]
MDMMRLSSELADVMALGGPTSLESMSTGFHFERSKFVDVPWRDVVGPFVDKAAAAALSAADGHLPGEYLQRHFMTHWVTVAKEDRAVMLPGEQIFLPDLASVVAVSEGVQKQIAEKKFPIRVEGLTARRAPYAKRHVDLKGIGTVCVLRLPTASIDRYFLPFGLSVHGKVEYFRDDALRDPSHSAHVDSWTRVRGLQQVYVALKPEGIQAAATEAVRSFSAMDEVDAAAAHIIREWNRFSIKNATATARRGAAQGMLDAAVKENLSSEAWAEISQRYVELASNEELLGMADVLRDRAASLRYELITEKMTVEHFHDGSAQPQKVSLEPGALYYKYPKSASWWTTHHNGYTWYGKKKRRRQLNTHVFQYYERVTPDWDPWVEAVAQYQADGFDVAMMRSTADGFVAEDGRTLAEVVEQCARDEGYRRRCVVGIPTLEDTLHGNPIVRGYRFYFRPLPAILPSAPPSIFVNEQLTYRFAWQGVRLGELAANIPLAPGEERSVTITRSVSKENSRTESSGSILELNTVTRQDFESTFESEITKEAEKTRTMSAEASGSYGGMVSGGASFSQTQRTRDVARTLNRAVQRASSEITSKRRQEVNVSMSSSIKESLSDSTSYKVSNINTGRTLNILIFRLMNEYRSALYLSDFSCVVEAGPELIEGTGLRVRRTFRKTAEEMQAMGDYLANAQYGFDIDPARRAELGAEVTRSLREAIAADYEVARGEAPALAKATLPMKPESKPLLKFNAAIFAPAKFAVSAEAKSPTVMLASVETERATMDAVAARTLDMQALAAFEGTNQPIIQEMTFAYDSGALYADCQLGARDGLEDFALQMRTLETNTKSADIELTRGRAALLMSAAGLARSGAQDGRTLARFVRRGPSRLLITFILSGEALPTKGWHLRDASSSFKMPVDEVSASGDAVLIVVTLNGEKAAPYLSLSDADLFSRCELVNE